MTDSEANRFYNNMKHVNEFLYREEDFKSRITQCRLTIVLEK